MTVRSPLRPVAQAARKAVSAHKEIDMSDHNGRVFRVYSVIDKGQDANGKDRDPFWHNIGTAFPHKDGKGFNVLLEVAPIPVDSVMKIVIREVEPKEAEAEDAPKKKSHSKR
jgi:hypothetical protein